MKPMPHIRINRGSALLVAVCVVFVFGLTVGYVMLSSSRQTRNVYRTEMMSDAMTGAASMVNSTSQEMMYLAKRRPPQVSGSISAINDTIENTLKFPEKAQGVVTVKTDKGMLGFIRATGANDGEYEEITDEDSPWYGYSTQRWSYRVVGFANVSDDGNDVSASAQRMGFEGAGFEKDVIMDYIPLYQFAIFYNEDLELHPGPVMDIKGPVHTNGNLWLSSIGGITFHDRVSAAGLYRSYNDFKLDGIDKGSFVQSEEQTGAINVISSVDSKLHNARTADTNRDTNGNSQIDGLDQNWLRDATNIWGMKFQDRSMGVHTLNPPLPEGSTGADMIARANPDDNDALKDAKFENKADVKIVGEPPSPDVLKLDHRDPAYQAAIQQVKVYRATGYDENDVPTGWAEVPNVGPDSSNPVWNVGEFYDGQQMTIVRTIDVDLGALKNLRNNSGDPLITWKNGIVYASTTEGYTLGDGIRDNWFPAGDPNQHPAGFDYSQDLGTDNYMGAVRVFDASATPANSGNGFAFATDRPLYVSGDFNTSGFDNDSNHHVALLAGDSMTVMSRMLDVDDTIELENHYDRHTRKSYTTPDEVSDAWNQDDIHTVNPGATRNTTTNAVFVMGNTPSTFEYDDHGKLRRVTQSGGAHNVLRYLENWSGKTHTVNGSIIVLFPSQIAYHPYRNDHGYYSPPNRNYNWDDRLKTSPPPPGMPVLLEITSENLTRISKQQAMEELNLKLAEGNKD